MFDIREYKPSIGSLLLFMLYLLIAAPLLKFVFTKWTVPGLTPLAQAV